MKYDITVTVAGEDISRFVVVNGTVDRGRASLGEGFTAPQAVFDVLTPYGWSTYIGDPDEFPQLDEGQEVLIHVTWDGLTQHRRFTGKIQALDYEPRWYRVTAAGNSVDLATKLVGDTTAGPPFIPIPPEQDIPSTGPTLPGRITRFADEAGVTINILGTQGRWLLGIPEHTAGVNMLEAILDIASDCDGLFRETEEGALDYIARIHDRPVRHLLPDGVVDLDSIGMSLERGTIRNGIYVEYGNPDPDTGQRPRAFALNTASVVARGERFGDTISTQLRYRIGAQGKAARWLTNNDKAWAADDVVLAMVHATGEEADAILALSESDPVRLGPLPAGAPMTYYDSDVLGFTELLHPFDYRIMLHLSPGSPAAGEDDGNWVVDGSITGGDETGTYVKDGREWRWHAFYTPTDGPPAVLHVEPGVSVTGRSLVLGGGGDGGAGHNNGILTFPGGGGGSGAAREDDNAYLESGDIPVYVGDHGEYSQFLTIRAYPGGDGGRQSPGEDGGSGGGGSGRYGATYPGGNALGGEVDGAATLDGFACEDGDDGSNYSAGDGGSAALVSDITGVDVTYGKGGTGGAGPNDGVNPGDGGDGALPGESQVGGLGHPGAVIVAYRISPGTSGFPYDTADWTYDSPLTYDQGT